MVKAGLKKILVISLVIIGFCRVGSSQYLDYQTIFGSDWENAVTFLKENENWIRPKLEQYKIPYSCAMAVVFPELIRYSALRDKMEISMLKTLYINLGTQYADFSIGVFQMKPSFAELILEKAPDVMGNKSKELFHCIRNYSDMRSLRASIVEDLENPEKQLNYLIAFFKICESSFDLYPMSKNDRLKFIATAYNYGFTSSTEQINNMIPKRFFNTKLLQTENYSYADVSLTWFKEYNAEVSSASTKAEAEIEK